MSATTHRPRDWKLAVVLVCNDRRRELVRDVVLPSILGQGFYQVVVVGEYMPGPGYTYRHVPKMLGTTVDALVKRDVGTLSAKHADAVMYLCDDHALSSNFHDTFQAKYAHAKWDALCPARYTIRDGEVIWLNVGRNERYAGGHAVIFRRYLAESCPWSAGPHHRNYDVLHSRWLISEGFEMRWSDPDLAVVDVEPGSQPWL